MKKCKICLIEKNIDLFYLRNGDNYRKECKECFIMKQKDNYLKNKEKIKIRKQKYLLTNIVKIKIKQKDNYLKNKEKIKIVNKNNYLKNKENRIVKQKIYLSKHKEENKIRCHNYYLKNKEVLIKKNSIKRNFRLKSDFIFRLTYNLRRRLNAALKGKNKSLQTLQLLGCSIEQLKQHLEVKFQPGMAWENYGVHGWHVDHIRPCSSFKLEDIKEQKQCFHYTNLQPLWSKDNLRKSDKYE